MRFHLDKGLDEGAVHVFKRQPNVSHNDQVGTENECLSRVLFRLIKLNCLVNNDECDVALVDDELTPLCETVVGGVVNTLVKAAKVGKDRSHHLRTRQLPNNIPSKNRRFAAHVCWSASLLVCRFTGLLNCWSPSLLVC